jgi:hypothetical protein
MFGNLTLTCLAAAIGLTGGNGLGVGDELSVYRATADADSIDLRLGPNLYELTTVDVEFANMYQSMHDVGNFLHVRGLSLEAMTILEELGDIALSREDYHVAIDAYGDAAWVANAAADDAPSASLPFEFGESGVAARRGHAMTAEAERLLRKAKDATDQAKGADDN